MTEPNYSNWRQPIRAIEVQRTPQGSLQLRDEVLLERSSSGRIRPWRPDVIEVGPGIEVIEAPALQPRNLFGTPHDEEDILDAPLAEALALDSGSEFDDEEPQTLEELQNILQDDPEPDAAPEADDEVNTANFDWTADFSTFAGIKEDFMREAGPKIQGTSPLGLFSHFFDIPLMNMIVKETNNYAWETIAKATETEPGIPAKSRVNDWVETSVPELYRLFGVIVLMGMCLRNRVDDYWTTGILGMPAFRELLSRDRYLLLMRFLHFADNNVMTVTGDERKVAKIRPLLNYLVNKFETAYSPRRELSLDESLLLWKGHLSWIQCIRTKAARFGIKTYELCEALSGYVLQTIIYTGKGPNTGPIHGFIGSTAKIVLTLMTNYLSKGYTLFMDNFYNSVTLTRFLKSRNTDVVGTLNRRRVDTPADIKSIQEKRMPKGTVVGRHCGDVSVLAWKDVKLVSTLSTYHNADMAPGQRAGRECSKPVMVHDYNKYMGGVDLKDQVLSSYLLERKRGLKWYIKVFKRLLNISINNSYIIYSWNMGQARKLTNREFRYKLAAEIREKYGVGSVSRHSYRETTCTRLDNSMNHFPEHRMTTEPRTKKQDRYKRARCVMCLSRKQRVMSNIICSQCQVFLCVGTCWREYHTLEGLPF